MFEALARGYLEGTGGTLLPAERERLVLAGKLFTFECGIRFLTDYLEGDHYFKIQRRRPQSRPLPHPVRAPALSDRVRGGPDLTLVRVAGVFRGPSYLTAPSAKPLTR